MMHRIVTNSKFLSTFIYRNQEPTFSSVKILEKIGDILAEQHLSKLEVRMELLLAVQDLASNCFEENVNAEVNNVSFN